MISDPLGLAFVVFNCLVAFVFKKLIVSWAFSLLDGAQILLRSSLARAGGQMGLETRFLAASSCSTPGCCRRKMEEEDNSFCRSVCHHISQMRAVSNIIIPWIRESENHQILSTCSGYDGYESWKHVETTVIHTLFAISHGWNGWTKAEERRARDEQKRLEEERKAKFGSTKTFDGCFLMWKLCEIQVKW